MSNGRVTVVLKPIKHDLKRKQSNSVQAHLMKFSFLETF